MSLDSAGQNSMIVLKARDIHANSTLSLFIYLASAAIKIDEAEALLFFFKGKVPFSLAVSSMTTKTPLLHRKMNKNDCEPTFNAHTSKLLQ